MSRAETDVVDRILGTLRKYGPLTTMELVRKTDMLYANVYPRLRSAEKKNRVTGFRIGPGESVLWSLNE